MKKEIRICDFTRIPGFLHSKRLNLFHFKKRLQNTRQTFGTFPHNYFHCPNPPSAMDYAILYKCREKCSSFYIWQNIKYKEPFSKEIIAFSSTNSLLTPTGKALVSVASVSGYFSPRSVTPPVSFSAVKSET